MRFAAAMLSAVCACSCGTTAATEFRPDLERPDDDVQRLFGELWAAGEINAVRDLAEAIEAHLVREAASVELIQLVRVRVLRYAAEFPERTVENRAGVEEAWRVVNAGRGITDGDA